MARLVKRYGSRKLYDTAASRYVSLDELAGYVREGEEVRVVDNRTGEDATAAVLTQIISEEGRRGEGPLSASFLHDLIRVGEATLRAGEQRLKESIKEGGDAVEARLRQARHEAEGFVQKSLARVQPAPLSEVRAEMARLRHRLQALEASLGELDGDPAPAEDDR